MRRDKLKGFDFRYFLVPFFILLLLFFVLTYMAVNNRIEKEYTNFEEEAVSIADSYSQALIYSDEAYDIISSLLEEKLVVASQAIMLIENKQDSQVLDELAERFKLDEIHLYNTDGEILYSKGNKYLGWKAYEGHPVYNFMKSSDKLLVEDIRKDSESEFYYKYAYIKNDDGSFLQIGVLADSIYELLGRFEKGELVNVLSNRNDILNVSFINNQYQIIASSSPEDEGHTIDDEDFLNLISTGSQHAARTNYQGRDVIHVCIPVYHDNEILGTLSVIWLTDRMEAAIKGIIINGMIQFVIVTFIVGVILYYAYRKNKSNIRIAYYDKLTGLPNSEYLAEYLQYEVDNIGNKKKAILLVNCKNFRTLNMTYGFKFGDEILTEISKKIIGVLSPKDKLFRFGADRFIIVIRDFNHKDDLANLAECILGIFKDPFSEKIEHQYVDVIISIVEIKGNKITVDKLLQDATLALAHINENSNKQYCFYEDIMEDEVIRKDKIEKRLRNVILNEGDNSLYLQFQPKLDVKNDKVIGFEALARLRIDGLGNIPPLEFIDIAEQRHLIYELGNLIIYKACRFLQKLNLEGYTDLTGSEYIWYTIIKR